MIASRAFLLGLAALLLLTAAPACGESEAPPEARPRRPAGSRTVVLVSIDTLRPARLGVYGNDGGPFPVSPHIDALAGEAVVFDQALAPSPWTLPSHMTMLTGLDPAAHGVHNEQYAPLSRHVTTMAEALAADGFATAAFTDGGFVHGRYGFDQGFDVYEDERNAPGEGPNGFARLLPAALEWLAEHDEGDVFLFVHTFDVHAPFAEGDPEVIARFRQRPVADGPQDWGLSIVRWYYQQQKMGLDRYHRLAELLNDYDAGVFEADRGVGQILQVLRDTGRADSALVVVTSDHGESFYDHGLHVGHGLGLHDDELAVPLVVRFPGREGAGTRRPELVGLVDLSRTVLDAMGVEAPAEMQGESLLQLVRGRPRKLDYLFGASQNTRSLFLVRDGHKYISPANVLPDEIAQRHLGPMQPPGPDLGVPPLAYQVGSGPNAIELRYDFLGDPLGVLDAVPRSEALYDRQADPDERRNLAREQHERVKVMAEYLRSLWLQSEALHTEAFFDPDSDAPGPDPATDRNLEALGYIATGNRSHAANMGAQVRRELKDPHVPLPSALLVQGDRLVQSVRARAAAGETLGPEAAQALADAGTAYRRWFETHGTAPAVAARVTWRAQALLELARSAGLDVDLRWAGPGASAPRGEPAGEAREAGPGDEASAAGADGGGSSGER